MSDSYLHETNEELKWKLAAAERNCEAKQATLEFYANEMRDLTAQAILIEEIKRLKLKNKELMSAINAITNCIKGVAND